MTKEELTAIKNKYIGYITRKRLDVFALILQAMAWTLYSIGNILLWHTCHTKNKKTADKRELREAKFKFWAKKVMTHSYTWGRTDYIRMTDATENIRHYLWKKLANPLCPRCYGQGQLGKRENTNSFIPCKCALKKLNELKADPKKEREFMAAAQKEYDELRQGKRILTLN